MGAWPLVLLADQVEMLNGDRYAGRVLSLGPDTLVVQSDVLGVLKLPRTKIATITLTSAALNRATNAVRLPPVASRSNTVARFSATTRTNASPDFSAAMRQLGGDSNVVQQVQQQFLAGAGPEATAKFNDLVGGLLSGKLDLEGLRAEAKATIAQAQSARKELGEQEGSTLDSYLAILEGFLHETEPTVAVTNAPASPGRPLAQKPAAEE